MFESFADTNQNRLFALFVWVQRYVLSHWRESIDLEEVLTHLLEGLTLETSPLKFSVWLWQPSEGALLRAGSFGIDKTFHNGIFEAGAHSVLENVYRDGTAIMVADARTTSDPLIRRWAIHEAVDAVWAYPLITHDGTIIGTFTVLWVNTSPPAEGNQDVFTYWQTVANSLALLIEWVRQSGQQGLAENRIAGLDTGAKTGMVIYGNDGIVQFVATECEALLGFPLPVGRTRAEILGLLGEHALGGPTRLTPLSHVPSEMVVTVQVEGVLRHVRWQSVAIPRTEQSLPSHIDIVSQLPAAEGERVERETLWSIVAHEFRTPITVIQGLSEWLTSSSVQVAPLVIEQLRGIQREADRLMRTLRGLWGAVHLMDVRWGSSRERLDLAQLVRSEMDSAARWRVRLRFDYRGEQTLPIWGNREVMITVLGTLLGNASQYSQPGSTIQVTVTRTEAGGHVTVCDNGPGVPAAIQPYLFKEWLDPRHHPEVKGLGIGLWVSSELLIRMGGTLTYSPLSGGGSVFTAVVPDLSPPSNSFAQGT